MNTTAQRTERAVQESITMYPSDWNIVQALKDSPKRSTSVQIIVRRYHRDHPEDFDPIEGERGQQ